MTIDDDIDPAEFQRMAAKLVAGTRRAPVLVEVRRSKIPPKPTSGTALEISVVELYEPGDEKCETTVWLTEELHGKRWRRVGEFWDRSKLMEEVHRLQHAGVRVSWLKREDTFVP